MFKEHLKPAIGRQYHDPDGVRFEVKRFERQDDGEGWRDTIVFSVRDQAQSTETREMLVRSEYWDQFVMQRCLMRVNDRGLTQPGELRSTDPVKARSAARDLIERFRRFTVSAR